MLALQLNIFRILSLSSMSRAVRRFHTRERNNSGARTVSCRTRELINNKSPVAVFDRVYVGPRNRTVIAYNRRYWQLRVIAFWRGRDARTHCENTTSHRRDGCVTIAAARLCRRTGRFGRVVCLFTRRAFGERSVQLAREYLIKSPRRTV